MRGRLIGVVGPSGAGKDTVMAGLAAAVPNVALVRRVITRAPEKGGEDYHPVSEEEFHKMKAAGAFCVDWAAHGFHYGIPDAVQRQIATDRILLVNLSRNVLTQMDAAFPGFTVLNVTASAETLAARLTERGRETPEQIRARLARKIDPLSATLSVVNVANDGSVDDAIAAAVKGLDLMPTPDPVDLDQ